MFYRRADPASRYIPPRARKVADRQSDALAYLYEVSGALYAIVYCGKRAKPDWHHRFRSDAERERCVRAHFATRRRALERKAAHRSAPGAQRQLYVGAILRTCWGYDQTNVEFFQVTALLGKTMVELREIQQAVVDTGWCQHSCAPVPDEFVGEPLRRKVSSYDGASVKIDDVRRAYRWTGENVQATSYA